MRRQAACIAVCLLGAGSISPAEGNHRLPHRPEAGAVATIAGPVFCDRPARVVPESLTVRSLAVDSEGTTFVDTGRPSEGAATRVDGLGRATLVRTPTARTTAGRLAPDGQGGLLVAAGVRIDQVPQTGATVTVAGDPNAPSDVAGFSSGDGGPAPEARFTKVQSLANEGANLYATDQVGGGPGLRIRFINRGTEPVIFYPGTPFQLAIGPGHIDTIAGAPGASFSFGGKPAREALIQGEAPVMAAVPGRLYVASYAGRSRSRSVVTLINTGGEDLDVHGLKTAPGEMRIVAGRSDSGAERSTTSAGRMSLSRVTGITVDPAGNLILAERDKHWVRKVDLSGTVSTVAGTGTAGFNGNDRPATGALLDQPFDVKSGPGGRIYITDSGNGQLRFVDRAGAVHTLPGNGLTLSWDCGGSPNVVNRHRPEEAPLSVTADKRGNAFFSLLATSRIYRAAPGGIVSPVAGSRRVLRQCADIHNCPNGDGGPINRARFMVPGAVVAGPGGGLYVLEGAGQTWNLDVEPVPGRVRFLNFGARAISVHGAKVMPGTVETVAGGDSRRPAGGGAEAMRAILSGDGAMASTGGSLFIADRPLRRVIRIDEKGRVEALIRRQADAGCCREPAGVAAGSVGSLYVSDRRGARVWFLNMLDEPVQIHGRSVAPGAMEPVAGTGKSGFEGDGGPALRARLGEPWGLAVDSKQNLYISDIGEHVVRKIDPSGTITTVAGAGSTGFNGDGLKGPLTGLSYPNALAFDRCGDLLIADRGNNRIRLLKLNEKCDAAKPQPPPSPAPKIPAPDPALAGAAVAVAAVAIYALRRRKRPGGGGGAPA